MIGERRIYLSPFFHSDPKNTNTSFINKIDEELVNSSRKIRVRLLSVYSSVDLPKISLYIGGLRRKSFGAGDHKTFFPFSPLDGGRRLGKLSYKKNGKKRGHCPLLATLPPKRVKRGHLLSDYRQKCVNGTHDSYCGVKSPFLSDLRLILTHIVVSKDSY